MANNSPARRFALPAAAFLLIALAALLLWPKPIAPPADDPAELPDPPVDAPLDWPSPPDDAPLLRWKLSPRATITLPDGSAFAPTPAPTQRHWNFRHHLLEGWTALIARAQNGDEAIWWIPLNAPYAILDLQADLSRGDWTIDLPDLPLRASPADLLTSTDDLDTLNTTPLSALTFTTHPAPLSITLEGPARASLDLAAASPRLRLEALPRDCESLLSAPSHVRIILHVGEAPLPLAAPSPPEARAQLIPIFAEPPDQGGAPWEEGRSHTPDEFARRIRALIFGHSNPEDPRYGNGGLLQQNLGASFVVPQLWWEAQPLTELREDLADTPYEFILSTESPEQAPPGLNLHTHAPLECAALTRHPFIIRSPGAPARYSLGEWLPQTPQTAHLATRRADILQHLLPPANAAGGLRPGRVTLTQIPLIASRNPLVDMYQQTLLIPERQGHWTLHEELSRALVAFEFREDRSRLSITSLAARGAAQHSSQPPAIWLPDDRLSDGTRQLLTPEGVIAPTSPQLKGPQALRWRIEP